jgi:signal transduction histidine kinase
VSGNFQRLDSALERQLYRIGIEAISNAVRHSGASGISVDLSYQPNSIRLTVCDNGCGFEPDAPTSNGSHIGLVGMRQRTARCRGSLSIVSSPGSGTEVRVEVPVAGG